MFTTFVVADLPTRADVEAPAVLQHDASRTLAQGQVHEERPRA